MDTRSVINVYEFYCLTLVLKNTIRSGWKRWNIKKERLESVAEHVYGACMLAIAMDSEFDYNIDIKKVVTMLAVHEVEEIVISDITPFDGVSKDEKMRIGHEAVEKIFAPLKKGLDYQSLIFEYDAGLTNDSIFAGMCDHLEADIMSFYYDDAGEYLFENASIEITSNIKLMELYVSGLKSMREFFYAYDRKYKEYDKNFLAVLDYVKSQVS